MKKTSAPQFTKNGIRRLPSTPKQNRIDRALTRTREMVEEAASHDGVVSGGLNDR